MLFELKNITVIRNKKTILNDISVQIEQKTSYVIVGPSGAGKTTLLRIFNLMTIPSYGKIWFRDKNAFEYPLIDYRRRISIVFQEPVLFQGTVEDNLFVPFSIKKFTNEKPSQDQLNKVLSICRLNPVFLKQNSQTLSIGEKQRTAIARALLIDSEVLLLDEPTSALDVETADRVISSILNQYKNITLIIVTHEAEIIEKIKKKIVLKNGKIERLYDKLSPNQLHKIVKEKP